VNNSKGFGFKNISIIGFMGSGKSTAGRLLAERLNFLFIDTDQIIMLAENSSISEIFKNYGEDYFRNVESEVIRKIYKKNKNCVFSCGGGVILREKNMQIIKENSFVLYLHISPIIAYKRLKDAEDRPLINKSDRKKEIEYLIDKRKDLYLKYADMIIEKGNINPEGIVEEIINKLELKKCKK
jgi:shikimate kinase